MLLLAGDPFASVASPFFCVTGGGALPLRAPCVRGRMVALFFAARRNERAHSSGGDR
ncbi:hypothetical protein FRAHR75_60098 [Frankia sp. Hr75.2]|nr:hypothetical protein FRAHR75_60098 [Frankia sp. Hr75.2]SQD98386.1 hypothetical protein FMEAI12_4630043 [Parafrankia sp. Ea1.12]